MLGMLSPNFRQVTLDHDGGQWLITFVLEREDAEDQEEIEDFGSEWDALQSGPEPRDVRTVVTSEALSWPSSPTRVLYLRREATRLAADYQQSTRRHFQVGSWPMPIKDAIPRRRIQDLLSRCQQHTAY